MFEYLEVAQLDAEFSWLDLNAADETHPEPAIVRIAMDRDHQKMATSFVSTYMTKRESSFELPDSQKHMIEEFCAEAVMAQVVWLGGNDSPDLLELLPTTVIHFKEPQKTSFRKSRAARIAQFTAEAVEARENRDFQRAMQRLDWVHLMDPSNEEAFEWKVICLRNWKKPVESVPVYEAWIAAQPESITAQLGLSELRLYLGQNEEARNAFASILAQNKNLILALLGYAQAKARLGEDPIPELRQAWVREPQFTVAIIENHFDFRLPNPPELEERTLKEVAALYQIPLRRVLDRARRGVLPMHPMEKDLLRFSKTELDRYYAVLKCVGLEIGRHIPRQEG